ncbi:hypothetical protein DPMN_018584 [Dreissena polymorpha]|uniref:Uncharacterized protein n=1 Tax=Dreissena polymorpha TaxID=45954 RepID=A0A9D4NDG4_DREPO|nr:hypothetical protein DPMN_018584 [Dreissena polymorpha]
MLLSGQEIHNETITALSDFIGDSFTPDQTAQMCRLSMSWGGQNAIRPMLHEAAMKE